MFEVCVEKIVDKTTGSVTELRPGKNHREKNSASIKRKEHSSTESLDEFELSLSKTVANSNFSRKNLSIEKLIHNIQSKEDKKCPVISMMEKQEVIEEDAKEHINTPDERTSKKEGNFFSQGFTEKKEPRFKINVQKNELEKSNNITPNRFPEQCNNRGRSTVITPQYHSNFTNNIFTFNNVNSKEEAKIDEEYIAGLINKLNLDTKQIMNAVHNNKEVNF